MSTKTLVPGLSERVRRVERGAASGPPSAANNEVTKGRMGAAGAGSRNRHVQAALDELFGAQGTREAWTVEVRRALERGRLEEAVALCSEQLQARPAEGLALFLRGVAHLELGHYGLAIADFSRAVASDLKYARLTETAAGR